MTQAASLPPPLRLSSFYARQALALNAGDWDAYRATFVPEAEFLLAGGPGPLRGAEAIVAHSRRLAEERAARGVVQRHHITMTAAARREDGVLVARSVTLVVTTPPGGVPAISASTVCEDEFDDGVGPTGPPRVRRRRVTPDSPRKETPCTSDRPPTGAG